MAKVLAGKDNSLGQVAYERIAQWIIEDKLKPGELLIETEVADRLKISRTPLREALRKLERDGLVEIVPGRGAFVSRISLKDVQELFEVREATEGMAARLAAKKVGAEELKKFEEQFALGDKEPDEAKHWDIYESAGDRLHDYIFQAAGNSRLMQIESTFRVQIRKERRVAALIPGRIEKSMREHREILEALKKRDPDLAEAAMRRHIVSTLNSVLEAYQKPF